MSGSTQPALRYDAMDDQTTIVRGFHGDSLGIVQRTQNGDFSAWRFGKRIGLYKSVKAAGRALDRADRKDGQVW